jgi:hypothetical protein
MAIVTTVRTAHLCFAIPLLFKKGARFQFCVPSGTHVSKHVRFGGKSVGTMFSTSYEYTEH